MFPTVTISGSVSTAAVVSVDDFTDSTCTTISRKGGMQHLVFKNTGTGSTRVQYGPAYKRNTYSGESLGFLLGRHTLEQP